MNRLASSPDPVRDAVCACARLRRASRAITQLYDDALAPTGLRVTQYSLLRTLEPHGTLRIGELAARALIDRTALTRTLDPLLERGLVAIDPGRDARSRDVQLTARGKKLLAAAAPHWKRVQQDVAERIGPDR